MQYWGRLLEGVLDLSNLQPIYLADRPSSPSPDPQDGSKRIFMESPSTPLGEGFRVRASKVKYTQSNPIGKDFNYGNGQC